jgi:hypothetical protein
MYKKYFLNFWMDVALGLYDTFIFQFWDGRRYVKCLMSFVK